ncbi:MULTISPECIES: PIG-L deacetylase family protein [Streptomyces]|uniref:PIG-L deacetylase family protein n=1 Tax=Streptomyces bacillaris TaxID=68179 RepID=A0ABW6E6I9_9ACTN|nr:PIG-L family deacetylase [Streptomyces nanshensis]
MTADARGSDAAGFGAGADAGAGFGAGASAGAGSEPDAGAGSGPDAGAGGPAVPVLVFSPHADDVVLSCFGALRPGGEVVTVFAGVPGDPAFLAPWDELLGARTSREMALERLREDAAAYRGTGVVLDAWDHLDGQYRTGPPDTGALRREMRERIGRTGEVWLPSAIGSHPDHLAVRDTGLAACRELAAAGRPPRVRLYADYPYQLFAMSNRHRAHGTWSTYTWHNADPLALTEWFGTHFPDASEEEARPLPYALDGDTTAAKERAIRCHRTQVPELDRASYGKLLDPANLGREYAWDLPAHLWEPVDAGPPPPPPPPPPAPSPPGGRDT